MRVGDRAGGFIQAYLWRMALPLYLVDAFTARPFAGNPAGVCLLSSPLPDDVMQNVAMEMHQAETAFLLPEGDGWRLRWFTPEVEENLCGHATLASAHVLFETGRIAPADDGPLPDEERPPDGRARGRRRSSSTSPPPPPRSSRRPRDRAEGALDLAPLLRQDALRPLLRGRDGSRGARPRRPTSRPWRRSRTGASSSRPGPTRGRRTTSSPASSHPAAASPRTPSPGRPTAPSGRTGRGSSGRPISSATRPLPAAGRSSSPATASGSASRGRPSPSSGASSSSRPERPYFPKRRSLRAFVTTLTDEAAIARLASIGFSVQPVTG